MGYSIEVVGLDEVTSAIAKKAKNIENVKAAVAMNGTRLQQQSQKAAPVDTGTLRRSIGLEIKDGGLTAECTAKAHYSGYVEYGTRFMAAQPYMRPSLNLVKHQFKADVERLVRK